MRLVIQRVSRAAVGVDDNIVGQIGLGLVVLVGVGREDTAQDASYLADKTASLRIFPDELGNMNRSLLDMGGSALVISQFTLYASCHKGRRPSWHLAAGPELGRELYEEYCMLLAQRVPIETGIFGAMMSVEIHNDGPVTIVMDSKRDF